MAAGRISCIVSASVASEESSFEETRRSRRCSYRIGNDRVIEDTHNPISNRFRFRCRLSSFFFSFSPRGLIAKTRLLIPVAGVVAYTERITYSRFRDGQCLVARISPRSYSTLWLRNGFYAFVVSACSKLQW